MKVFAFIFVAITLVVEITASDFEEMNKNTVKWANECGTELNMSQEKVDEFLGIKESTEMSETWISCLAACLLEKAGIMKNEEIDEGAIHAFIDKDKEDNERFEEMEKLSKICREKANRETEKCEVAGFYIKCIYADTRE